MGGWWLRLGENYGLLVAPYEIHRLLGYDDRACANFVAPQVCRRNHRESTATISLAYPIKCDIREVHLEKKNRLRRYRGDSTFRERKRGERCFTSDAALVCLNDVSIVLTIR
jgi:hypothetical protein